MPSDEVASAKRAKSDGDSNGSGSACMLIEVSNTRDGDNADTGAAGAEELENPRLTGPAANGRFMMGGGGSTGVGTAV